MRWLGDDAAVVRSGGRFAIVSTDSMAEGVHFRLDWAGPAAIGHRALAGALSDIAAMGAAAGEVPTSRSASVARSTRRRRSSWCAAPRPSRRAAA